MLPITSGFALILFGIAIFLFIGFTFLVRQGLKPDLRPLRAYDNLFNQVGQAVESGGRVHIGLGSNGIIDKDTGVTLAGLQLLDIISEASSISDRSPIATTSDATTVFVASDTVRHAYQRRGTIDRYETMSTRIVALDPYSYAGGAASIVADDRVRTNFLLGSFGPEIALISEAGHRANIPQIIGSDRLEGQAVGYVLTDHNLIGEEIFTTRAYVLKDAPAVGSLLTQDVLRWIVVGAILLGVILKTIGLV